MTDCEFFLGRTYKTVISGNSGLHLLWVFSVATTMQLSLDLYPIPARHPFCGDAYVVNVGGWRNCVVYGADSFPPTDAVFDPADILSFDMPSGHPWIAQMRSEAWSANCSHFLLYQESGAFLIPVHGGQSFCDPLRSLGFMQECLRGLEAAENANFGKKPKTSPTHDA